MNRNGRRSNLMVRCERHFRRLAKKLGARRRGDVVAVEPETGNCFVGKDELDVVLRARMAFPKSVLGLFRIGSRCVHKLRGWHG